MKKFDMNAIEGETAGELAERLKNASRVAYQAWENGDPEHEQEDLLEEMNNDALALFLFLLAKIK